MSSCVDGDDMVALESKDSSTSNKGMLKILYVECFADRLDT